MKTIFVDPFSLALCPLHILCNDHQIGVATGFFWQVGDDISLVTNWHVLSGRRPSDGQPIHPQGAIPDKIEVLARSPNMSPHLYKLSLALYNGDTPCWSQHKEFGQDVDVAVLSLLDSLGATELENIRKFIPTAINLLETADLQIGIASDVFILGFPLGIVATDVLPIWKRASVATEYQFQVRGKPAFLVDTATREGMSGSPVIKRSVGAHTFADGATAFGPGTATSFLGVYSGRYVGELQEAQLGIVWKSELLTDLLAEPAPGSFILRKS